MCSKLKNAIEVHSASNPGGASQHSPLHCSDDNGVKHHSGWQREGRLEGLREERSGWREGERVTNGGVKKCHYFYKLIVLLLIF